MTIKPTMLIAGGSGFIGQALVKYFIQKNYQLLVLGRNKTKLRQIFPADVNVLSWDELMLHKAPVDIIINLAGENIAAKRWTEKRKQLIFNSRINAVTRLVDFCKQLAVKPSCFICASGVGIYEDLEHLHTEEVPIEKDKLHTFLGKLAWAWEQAAQTARELNIRVINLRLGAVMHPSGGVLKQLLIPYRFGLGGRLGTGMQAFPWIALPDVVQAIDFIIHHNVISGPVNLVAPQIISQQEFARCLADVLHRPMLFSMPTGLVKLFFGQMGQELLLTGVKVIPKKLQEQGFRFAYPELRLALTDLLKNKY